jgi:hypothetical protein
MRRIQNITDEPIQRHTILFEKAEIIFTLRFYPRTQIWMFDAEFGDKKVYCLKLSVGVLHMLSQNQPFDFVCIDRSGNGIDPFTRQDFSGGRCNIYMLEAADMVLIRGIEVAF